jgi:hypothetical protein
MAKINAFPSGNGVVWQFFSNPMTWSALQWVSSPASYPLDPAATVVVDFDEITNAALVADIQANTHLYTVVMVSGVAQLQKNGVAVSITASGALHPLRTAILATSDATVKSAIAALWNGTATAVQQQKAIAYCLLKLNDAGLI